ncbi:hypothetical protein VHEMI01243 [[Torrubiella] hemipterigena]|uniref:Concanavalin A-like lectin/glucanase n=1 Tax=[Torrubiella] hemipterigena TaxID=1531966 RepID=A0A0A1T494_9HYPO|nr:hypothetical protein VHEMI01243 [[Torrubiella] hemipterigena]
MKFSLVAAAAGLVAGANAEVQDSAVWSGVVNAMVNTNYVSGTVVVPAINKTASHANESATIWVGIDGSNCTNALLQTGFYLFGDGTYKAWYRWRPDYASDFETDLPIAAGNKIRMSVNATNATSGYALIENLTTKKQAKHAYKKDPAALCLSEAAWIVEDQLLNGKQVPFLNYGNFTFTDVKVKSSKGNVDATGGDDEILVTNDGKVKKSACDNNGSTIFCKWFSKGY